MSYSISHFRLPPGWPPRRKPVPVPECLWDMIMARSLFYDPGTVKLEMSSSQSSQFDFLALPIELQILIVRAYLDRWSASFPLLEFTPSLIRALRGQTRIYEEALAILYSSKQFSISMKNEHSVLAMPKSIQKRVTNVTLWYGYVTYLFLLPSRKP